MTRAITVEELHRALGGEIRRGKSGHCVVCPGPGHSHKDRSLAVSPANNADGFVVHSFADDDPIACKDFVRDKAGLDPFRPHNGKDHSASRTIVGEYDYTDESGQFLFQVVRYEPKDFRQRQSDGRGGWIWNLDSVKRVPYRLPELIEAVASGHPVFVVEGEKDADTLWSTNIPATCNPGGAGKWLDQYSKYLRGATVYILPDNDESGRNHASEVKASLELGGGDPVMAVYQPGDVLCAVLSQ